MDGDGIEPATFESWIAEALASPVRESVERHFVVATLVAGERSEPTGEALRVRLARRGALRAGARRRAPARNRTRDVRNAVASRNRRDRTGASLRDRLCDRDRARIARDVVEGHFLPATETAETEEGYVGARAYSRENSRASDARWLHLADECERFDAEVRKLVVGNLSNRTRRSGVRSPLGPRTDFI